MQTELFGIKKLISAAVKHLQVIQQCSQRAQCGNHVSHSGPLKGIFGLIMFLAGLHNAVIII